jgi:Holliday junction resolvase RusA-like endonuclease
MAICDVEINPGDLPFMPPPARIIAVDLPVPPSTNKLWRQGGGDTYGRVHLSKAYKTWKHTADMQVMADGGLRGFKTIKGEFEVRIVLDRDQNARGDLDNRIKALLDWAQSREIIANDKHCQRIIAEYGEAHQGCRLIVKEL